MALAEGAFEVVFVCTGNRARSPLAEALLSQRIRDLAVLVRSVGVLDVGSVPALPGAVRAGRRVGVDLRHHVARPLQTRELANVDLVVGFEPAHVSASVVDGCAQESRAFSLIELAQLLEGIRNERTHVVSPPGPVVREAHLRRTGSFLSAPAIADPYGGSEEAFMRTADQIDACVATIAEVIFGVSPG